MTGDCSKWVLAEPNNFSGGAWGSDGKINVLKTSENGSAHQLSVQERVWQFIEWLGIVVRNCNRVFEYSYHKFVIIRNYYIFDMFIISLWSPDKVVEILKRTVL